MGVRAAAVAAVAAAAGREAAVVVAAAGGGGGGGGGGRRQRYDGAAFGCLSSFDWATLDSISLEALSTAPTKGKPVAAPSHLASTKSAALDFGLRYFVDTVGCHPSNNKRERESSFTLHTLFFWGSDFFCKSSFFNVTWTPAPVLSCSFVSSLLFKTRRHTLYVSV